MKKPKEQGSIKKFPQNLEESTSCYNLTGCLAVSFAHLTNSNDHNYEYFGSDKTNELKSRKDLVKLLEEITSNNWVVLGQRNKYQKGGFEKMSWSDFSGFSAKNITIPADQNIYVFRFNQQNDRVFGFKNSKCCTFHIIGFDFNFSAYDHGN